MIKKIFIALSLLLLLFVTAIFTIKAFGIMIGNGFSQLHRNGFFIPEESSLSTFRETQQSQGSGEYWLYGEDEGYYYSMHVAGFDKPHIKISRGKAKTINGFDKLNYKTWASVFICGDLLKIYAEKPDNLIFVACETVTNSQTKVRARYKVSGKQSKVVEDFLIKTYGMGKLTWGCCGWEIRGKYGGFEHPDLTKIDPNLVASITMYADANIEDKNSPIDFSLEFDRENIAYFTVMVELFII